ncbi:MULTISPECIES: tyrosine-type recombinase/integrase [Microbacterium]|uniref:tyrosine-type recombinase/integrase n=1 Tax=unclassified Microbacterium TaxID=2609290 RepID=UPI00301AB47B
MLDGMLDGWRAQQTARFLKVATIAARERLVRRFVAFSGMYPWQWTSAEVEAWIGELRSGAKPLRLSTLRGYEIDIKMFCEYVTDPRYPWLSECEARFGAAPRQVFHEDNSIVHVSEYEGDAARRPLTFDEVQALFDAADGLAARIRSRRRKGAVQALRDAALLKCVYAFGLRRREAVMLDLVDLRRNAKQPQLDRFGALSVRHGKASRGGPSKRRTVLTVPEMGWIAETLGHYLEEVRPALSSSGSSPALWVTERGTRLSRRAANEAFCAARDAAGIDSSLDLHSLRHSYVTHLVEFDYPERFIQEQVGHSFSSTTAIYVGVSNEYRNRLLTQAIHMRYGTDLEEAAL